MSASPPEGIQKASLCRLQEIHGAGATAMQRMQTNLLLLTGMSKCRLATAQTRVQEVERRGKGKSVFQFSGGCGLITCLVSHAVCWMDDKKREITLNRTHENIFEASDSDLVELVFIAPIPRKNDTQSMPPTPCPNVCPLNHRSTPIRNG